MSSELVRQLSKILSSTQWFIKCKNVAPIISRMIWKLSLIVDFYWCKCPSRTCNAMFRQHPHKFSQDAISKVSEVFQKISAKLKEQDIWTDTGWSDRLSIELGNEEIRNDLEGQMRVYEYGKSSSKANMGKEGKLYHSWSQWKLVHLFKIRQRLVDFRRACIIGCIIQKS